MSDSCAVTGLFHVLVKTNDLPQTLAFYTQVLGLREAKRPPFGFPGAWLACSTPSGDIIIHVWAGGPGMGPETPEFTFKCSRPACSNRGELVKSCNNSASSPKLMRNAISFLRRTCEKDPSKA